MTNSITPRKARQAARRIRQLPAYQIRLRYRQAGFTQWDIAKAAGVSQSAVAQTIHRRRVNGEAAQKVWATLERILNGEQP